MSAFTQTATRRNRLAAVPLALIALKIVSLASLSAVMVRDSIEAHLYAVALSAQ